MLKSVDVRKDLVSLKHKLSQNPSSYKQEFTQYLNFFASSYEIYNLKPNKLNQNLINIAFFISESSKYFKNECKEFPLNILEALKKQCKLMHPEIRYSFYKCLMILFNVGLITSDDIIFISYHLLDVQDKRLRETIKTYLVKHIHLLKSQKLDKKEMTNIYMKIFKKLSDTTNTVIPNITLDVLCSLYQDKHIADDRLANVIADACFSHDQKVAFKAVVFLLGKDMSYGDILDSSSAKKDEELEKKKQKAINTAKEYKSMVFKSKVFKKSHSVQKKIIKLEKESKDAQNDFQNEEEEKVKYTIFDKIYDSESFCKKMVSQIQNRYFNQEFKLLQSELVAKIISHKKIFVLSFFSFLEMNMKVGSKTATKYMYFSALATHNLIPHQITEHLMRTISKNFIMEGNRSEYITYGINTVRVICTKNPDAMTKDLLESIICFRSSKEKPVTNSAIALLTLYREINPDLLPSKYRGRNQKKDESSEEDSESDEINSENECSIDDGENSESEEDESDNSENDEKDITIQDIENIKGLKTKKIADRAEMEANRKEKIANKFKNWRMNPMASTTNKEKAKKILILF